MAGKKPSAVRRDIFVESTTPKDPSSVQERHNLKVSQKMSPLSGLMVSLGFRNYKYFAPPELPKRYVKEHRVGHAWRGYALGHFTRPDGKDIVRHYRNRMR